MSLYHRKEQERAIAEAKAQRILPSVEHLESRLLDVGLFVEDGSRISYLEAYARTVALAGYLLEALKRTDPSYELNTVSELTLGGDKDAS